MIALLKECGAQFETYHLDHSVVFWSGSQIQRRKLVEICESKDPTVVKSSQAVEAVEADHCDRNHLFVNTTINPTVSQMLGM